MEPSQEAGALNGPSEAGGVRSPRVSVPRNVLIAEDDPDLRALVATALRGDGYQVIEARDGGELLDRMADWICYRWPDEAIDLIVSDVRMPGFTAVDVVSGLRSAHWDTPVILITAYADSQLWCDADRLGIRAVFAKPFDVDDLRTAVMNVLVREHPDPRQRDEQRPRYAKFDELEAEFIPSVRTPRKDRAD